MNESMHKYMQVGLIHPMAYPSTLRGEGPILETLKKIALDDYFDAVEVTRIKDEEVRKQAKEMIETSRLTMAYSAQPRLLTQSLNINHIDDTERLKALNELKASVDEAYYMNAVGLAFLAGTYEEETKEESYSQLVKSVKELCTYAESKGNLKIILEVFDFDVDKKALIGPVDLAKRFAEEIIAEHKNFGLMVDLSHLPLVRESAREAILPIKDYIVHAHIGNAVCDSEEQEAYGDQHPRFGFPGSKNDVPELVEYLKVLMEIGFLNTENPPIVSFEVKPWGNEDPDLVVANAKRTLNEAWAKL